MAGIFSRETLVFISFVLRRDFLNRNLDISNSCWLQHVYLTFAIASLCCFDWFSAFFFLAMLHVVGIWVCHVQLLCFRMARLLSDLCCVALCLWLHFCFVVVWQLVCSVCSFNCFAPIAFVALDSAGLFASCWLLLFSWVQFMRLVCWRVGSGEVLAQFRGSRFNIFGKSASHPLSALAERPQVLGRGTHLDRFSGQQMWKFSKIQISRVWVDF